MSKQRTQLVVAAVAVLAMAGGLVAVLGWPRTVAGEAVGVETSDPNRDPFDQAVVHLATSPAVHLRTAAMDARVTGSGELVGSVSMLGSKIEILTVDGRTFVKPPKGFRMPGGGAEVPERYVADQWITGVDEVFRPKAQQAMSPVALATMLSTALDETRELPDLDAANVPINGLPALMAPTPHGDLYISAEKPHRVLRFVPSVNTRQIPSLSGTGAQPSEEMQLDIEALSVPEASATYDRLTERARALSQAVDTSVRFDLQGSANVSCGPGGCLVTANASSRIVAKGTITGGQVTATMTATLSIEGRPAGSCVGTTVMPPNGSGSISCQNPGAGAVFSAVETDKKAAARAQSAASRGRPVPYTITTTGTAHVVALAQVNVAQIVETLDANRRKVECAVPSNSFAAGTLVLMADGSRTPIEAVRVGNRVWSSDPNTGTSGPRTVTATIGGGVMRTQQVVDITMGSSTITATTAHPFWLPEARKWVAAGELRAGWRLRTSTGAWIPIRAIVVRESTERVHNLSVDGLHAYHVLAGTVAVLSHNAQPKQNCPALLPDRDAASRSGTKPDPASNGRYTTAGRALQKHAGRDGNPKGWPTPAGTQNPKSWDDAGQNTLDDILTHPGSMSTQGWGRINGQWQQTIDVRLPDGRGARFSLTGEFSGFLD